MKLKELYETCGEITSSKGFQTNQHATQICLIATEVAEALEHINITSCGYETKMFIETLRTLSDVYEKYRKDEAISHEDNSSLENLNEFLEEMADIQIRIASYISGNNFYDEFEEILKAKIEKNKNRPYLHGKKF